MAEKDPRAKARDTADRTLSELEGQILPVIQDALDRVAERFARDVLHARAALDADELTAQGEPIDELDLQRLIILWSNEVPEIAEQLTTAYTTSAASTARRFGASVPDTVTTRLVDAYLGTATNRLTGVGDTLWNAARTELSSGVAQGEGHDVLRRRLQEAFARDGKELGASRAETIARTEVGNAWNSAHMDVARVMDEDLRPEYKTWLATISEATRDAHWAADGQTVLLDAKFIVGGEEMDRPGDPAGSPGNTINCRCVVTLGDDVEPPSDDGRQYLDDEQIDAEIREREERGIVREVFATGIVSPHVRTGQVLHDSHRVIAGPGASDETRSKALCNTGGAAGDLGRAPQHEGALMNATYSWVDWLASVTAAGEPHTSGMIALVPSAEDAARLALDGGEPAEELHLTLHFLGPVDDIPAQARQTLLDEVATVAGQRGPREGHAFAVSMFNPAGEEPCWVLGIGGEDLPEMHLAANAAVSNASNGWSAPEQHQPWAPHSTLIYSDNLALAAPVAERVGPITFDRLRVALGDDVHDFPLTGDDVVAQGEEDMRTWSTPDPRAIAFEDTETGDGRIFAAGALYWEDEGNGWPLMGNENLNSHDDAELIGPIKTMDRAGRRIAATGGLYTNNDVAAKVIDLLERDAPLGISVDLDDIDVELIYKGDDEDAEEIILVASAHRASVLNLGGGRYRFSLPKQINMTASAHHGIGYRQWMDQECITAAAGDTDDEDGEIIFEAHSGDEVFRFTRARIRGATIVSLPAYAPAGIVLDPVDGVAAADTAELAEAGTLMGSVVTYVNAHPNGVKAVDVAEALNMDAATARTYLVRGVDAGRLVRMRRGVYGPSPVAYDNVAATTVPVTQPSSTMETATGASPHGDVTAAVVGDVDLTIHEDPDEEWDGDAAASRVLAWANTRAENSDEPPSEFLSRAFLWRDDDANANAVTAYSLGFADVFGDELHIVRNGVFATAGGRGVDATNLSEEDKERVRRRICGLYDRLADTFDEDEGRVCPWDRDDDAADIEAAAPVEIEASAWSKFAAMPPMPAAWFAEPTADELPPDSGGVHVVDGRTYGWVVKHGVPHEGRPGQFTLKHLLRRGPVDTTHFLRRQRLLDDGSTVNVGAFTMNVGHHRDGGECETAACQFDNTRTVAGIVTVGVNDRGMWFSGAAAPWLSEWDREVFATCQPSYRVRELRDGRYSLRAVLSVPMPAHPSKLVASAGDDDLDDHAAIRLVADVVDRANLSLNPLGSLDLSGIATAVVDEIERREAARAEVADLAASLAPVREEVAASVVARVHGNQPEGE